MYLMIRNAGVADYQSFSLLGVSTTRYANRVGTIGVFGSGSKHALSLFLRYNTNPVIITGNLKMEFFSKPKIISGDQFDQVYVKYSGKDIDGSTKNNTSDLGWVLQWGTKDWTDLSMAFREFVSNAIDGATLAGGSYKDVEFEVVDKPRAKAGHTAVFLPLTPEVQECWKKLGTTFLHFSHPEYLNQKLLPKVDPDKNVTLIYKNGVLARTVDECSVFNYNLGSELTLDESRNAQLWDVRYACSHAIAKASAGDLAQIMMAQLDGNTRFENTLESCYLYGEYDTESVRAEKAKAFQTAFKTVAGDNAVLCAGAKQVQDFITRKGFKPVKLADTWQKALAKYGIPSENDVLSGLEKDGKVVSDATEEMIACTKKVWAVLEAFNLTNNKPMPNVKGFMSIMDGAAQTFGYYIFGGDTIYLHTSLGAGKMMFKVALEELVHYISQSADFSRDIQDYLFNLITEMSY